MVQSRVEQQKQQEDIAVAYLLMLEEPYLRPTVQKYCFPSALDVSKDITNGVKEMMVMLSILPKELSRSYRIELVREGPVTWDLRLCLDPMVWFNLMYDKSLDKDRPIMLGQMYIEGAMIAHDMLPAADKKLPTKCNKRPCDKGASCERKFRKDHKHYNHPEWACNRHIKDTRLGIMHPCDLVLYTESLVYRSTDVSAASRFFRNYSICSRWKEFARELMIMPNPNVPDNPLPHSNIKMVVLENFWETAAKLVSLLEHLHQVNNNNNNKVDESATNRVVINFGEWESGVRANPYLEESHAHAHVWLSSSFILAMQTQPPEKCSIEHTRLHQILKGYYYRPQDYLDVNSRNLAIRILPLAQLAGHNKTMAKLDQIHQLQQTQHDQVMQLLILLQQLQVSNKGSSL
eukprot:gene8993-10548_t